MSKWEKSIYGHVDDLNVKGSKSISFLLQEQNYSSISRYPSPQNFNTKLPRFQLLISSIDKRNDKFDDFMRCSHSLLNMFKPNLPHHLFQHDKDYQLSEDNNYTNETNYQNNLHKSSSFLTFLTKKKMVEQTPSRAYNVAMETGKRKSLISPQNSTRDHQIAINKEFTRSSKRSLYQDIQKNNNRDGIKQHGDGKLKYFECLFCMKISKMKGHMRQHINTVHKKVRPYPCSVQGCSSKLITRFALNQVSTQSFRLVFWKERKVLESLWTPQQANWIWIFLLICYTAYVDRSWEKETICLQGLWESFWAEISSNSAWKNAARVDPCETTKEKQKCWHALLLNVDITLMNNEKVKRLWTRCLVDS